MKLRLLSQHRNTICLLLWLMSFTAWQHYTLAEEATPKPVAVALTAEAQAAADALLAKHGKAALAYYRSWENKDTPEAQVLAKIEYLLAKGAKVNAKDKWGDYPIRGEAMYGSVATVKKLTELGADPHQQGLRDNTPLHYAACYNADVAVVKHIISMGADVELRNYEGNTPLFLAAGGNTNIEIVKFLVAHGASIHTKNKLGYTLLHQAAMRLRHDPGSDKLVGDIAAAQYLVNLGLDPKAKDNFGQTPLHLAESAELARYFVSLGLDIDNKSNSGKTPLHTTFNFNVMEYLISQGANIHAKDDLGQTPLDCALLSRKNAKIREFLISNGAKLNVKEVAIADGTLKTTILHELIIDHTDSGFETIKFLIKSGADVNAKTNYDGDTPLHRAVRTSFAREVLNYLKIIKYLIANGADLNARNRYGATPIFVASSVDVADFLISQGADISVRDNRGNLPLQWATWGGKLDIAKCLITAGADPHSRGQYRDSLLHGVVCRNSDKNLDLLKYLLTLELDVNATNQIGNTPLHLAARLNENVAFCEALVAAGADVNACNNKGGTPLHEAAKDNKNAAVFELLVSKGGNPELKNNGGFTPNDLKPVIRPAIPPGW